MSRSSKLMLMFLSVLKAETDIITTKAASLIGQAEILVIMFVEIFKTDVIVFICNIIMCLTSHWPIFCSQYQCPLILIISHSEIKEKMSKLLIKHIIHTYFHLFIWMYMKFKMSLSKHQWFKMIFNSLSIFPPINENWHYKWHCTMLHLFNDLWLDKIIPKNNDRKESHIWKSRE